MTWKELGLTIIRKLMFYIRPELLVAMIMGASLLVLVSAWNSLTLFETMVFISSLIFGAISYQMIYLNRISEMFGALLKGFGLSSLSTVSKDLLIKEDSNDNTTTNS